MEDDLEKRIADLEGRPAEPADEADEHSVIRRAVKLWWMAVAVAVLTVLGYAPLERIFPVLRNPAPSWVGLLVLATPFVAVAIYFVVRWRRRR